MACVLLLMVAFAEKNPAYKIPDADECEQRSEETPAPLPHCAVGFFSSVAL